MEGDCEVETEVGQDVEVAAEVTVSNTPTYDTTLAVAPMLARNWPPASSGDATRGRSRVSNIESEP